VPPAPEPAPAPAPATPPPAGPAAGLGAALAAEHSFTPLQLATAPSPSLLAPSPPPHALAAAAPPPGYGLGELAGLVERLGALVDRGSLDDVFFSMRTFRHQLLTENLPNATVNAYEAGQI
jgi:hypothetical protein